MSVRVTFWLGAPDGVKGHLLAGPLAEFLQFLSDMERKDPRLNIPGLQLLVERVIRLGEAALSVDTTEQAALVDALVEIYYNWFCGGEGIRATLLIPANDSMIGAKAFHDHRQLVDQVFGTKASRYWSYLLDGRGIGRHGVEYPYRPTVDESVRVGFWTADECQDFLTTMLAYSARNQGFFLDPEQWDIEATRQALQKGVQERTGIILIVA
ncbi:MAG TPA: hypothetical protein VKA60_11735 [Blastocatellia bacterium]|nr:hypothetical protein [Blastocatellia bacterium]